VVDRAQSDGENELPRSTEEVVTGTQKEIVYYFTELQKRAQKQASASVDKIRNYGDDIDLSEVVGNLRDIPPRCESELRRLSSELQSEHDSVWERETQHQIHYEEFREANQLTRVAKYPSSPWTPHAITVILIVAGTIAFREILIGLNSNALIPVLWTISALTLVALVPFTIARSAFRLVNHVGEARQLAGWLSGVIAMVSIGAMAIFVAHYISTITVTPEATVRSVVESILEAPTSINADMAVWTGFGIVFLVGLAAFLVGYKSDDSYPGYGAIQRAFYSAREERERFLMRMRKRLNIIVDKAESEATKLRRHVKSRVRQFSKLVDQSKRIPVAFDDYNRALEDACNILLDRYRAANGEARQSEMPLSFSEHICFRTDDVSSSMIADGEHRREELQKSATALETEVEQVRQKLRDLNWSALSPLDMPRQQEETGSAR
jgi:DNA-directed RNA polymerase subunit F